MDDFELQLNSLPFGSCAASCEESKASEISFTDIWPLVNYGETELVAGGNLSETESDAGVKCHETTVKIPEADIKKTETTKILNCGMVFQEEKKSAKEFGGKGIDTIPEFETDEISCLTELRFTETELISEMKLEVQLKPN